MSSPKWLSIFPVYALAALIAGSSVLAAEAPTAPAAQATPKVYCVAPDGKAENKGTEDSPWDIASALSGQQKIQAPAEIRLRAGTYKRRPNEMFEVRLAGEKDKPIRIGPARPGERVIIDGGFVVQDPAAHVWISDLEILISEPKPTAAEADKPDAPRRPNGGINAAGGRNCRFINLVIHDCNTGVSLWAPAVGAELYGCIIYDSGVIEKGTGRGPNVSSQNQDEFKIIADNIITGGLSRSIMCYGSAKAYVENYLIEGNIVYDAQQLLVGGGRPSKGIRVIGNCLYNVTMQIGYGAESEDCEVRDNVIVNGGLSIVKFAKAVSEGNLVLAKGAPRPKEASRVILRPNKYDANRAHLAIFNWANAATVEVDTGGFLRDGEKFRLMNPRDFFGKPAHEGVCEGGKITVPMKGEFAAFVLLR